jgi:hypothetical protein
MVTIIQELTPEYIQKLNEANEHDTEKAHVMADEILCELLTRLGFEDVVNLYNNIDKWYA